MNRSLARFRLAASVAALLPVIGFFLSWGQLDCEIEGLPTGELQHLEFRLQIPTDQARGARVMGIFSGQPRPVSGCWGFVSEGSVELRKEGDRYKMITHPGRDPNFEWNLTQGELKLWIPLTGGDAGGYGYIVLAAGLLGLAFSLAALRIPSRAVSVASYTLPALGIFFLFSIRSQPGVTAAWGSVSYAVKDFDPSLGYPLGPGLALLGFLACLALNVTADRLSKTIHP